MVISERQMIGKLRNAKNVLLVEPDYQRKYPPLGLAKIKTFLLNHGAKITFARDILPQKFDLICVTTLFTYYSDKVFKVLNNRGIMNKDTPILVGGILASILPKQFDHFHNTSTFVGYSKTLDMCKPDVELMEDIKDPWNTFSYIFTSRGCPNKCLRGDTLVNTVKGDIPIKDLVGKRFGVYTYSPETKEVFISKAVHVRKMGVKKLVRVHFDDDTHIDCTPDHKFLTFTQGNQFKNTEEVEVEAKDLNYLDRIRAVKFYKSKDGYVTVSWGRRKRALQHRMVAEYKLKRKLKKKEIVHHKDKIKSNNRKGNLEIFPSKKAHYAHHPEIAERMHNDNPRKYWTEESKAKMSKAITGKKRSLGTRIALRNAKLGINNPNYKNGNHTGQESRISAVNHKVIKVESLPGKHETYDLEVPETGWFFANNVLVHNCKYCVVWRIEKKRWVNDDWKDLVDLSKPNLMISDNNLSAVTLDHIKEIIDFSVDNKKKILFDNGFDCKHITKEMAEQLARCTFIRQGMRMAFDRIEEDGIFQPAVQLLLDAGVKKSHMMAYVLFNFNDRPKDAYYRARECDNLGVRPYPQYYRPLTTLHKSDKFIGKHWTLNLGRAFRNFWLMRGIYSKMNFDEYLQTDDAKIKFKINAEDIKMWDNNGVS